MLTSPVTIRSVGGTSQGTGMLLGSGTDSHRDKYIFGYKVHIMLDSDSGLPIMLTVTKAGFGENKTVRWFVRMVLRLSLNVKKFIADAAYDSVKKDKASYN
jgi:IS5 family transposase